MACAWRRLGLGLVLAVALAAQTPAIQGVIVAGNGLPIPGASVSGAGQQVRSGADGSFRLTAAAGEITVAAPGYSTRTLPVGAAPLRIVLTPAPLAESVTVTASAVNQPVTAAALDTVVMGSARLRSSAAPNADSILREFSDLGTFRVDSSLTANPTTQGVALLGAGSSGASRALVLLDGLPLNDIYGGWVDWLRVPDEDLSSVSVVSGGASPLYGNDALTGVIGIETRPPLTTGFAVRAGGGQLGTALADGQGVIAGRRAALAVRARAMHVGGYIPASPAGPVDTPAGVSAQDWAPQFRYFLSPRLMLQTSGEYFAENRRNGTRLQVNGTRLRQVAGRAVAETHGVWDASAFYQSEDYDQTFSAVAPDRSSEHLTLEQTVPSRAAGAGVNWSNAIGAWNLVAGGSFTRVSAVDNETRPPALTTTQAENGRQLLGGGFLEATLAAGARWTFTGTLRRDGWRNRDAFQSTPTGISPFPARSSSAWSPSLGAIWRLHSWITLRASGYQSFRAPTLNELYRPFRVGNVETLANPLLAAERYRGAQVGMDLTPGTHTRLQVTYFDGTIANLVTSVTLSTTPALITRQRQNLGRARSRGVTSTGEWQARPGLTLWGSYTHDTATVLDAPALDLIGLAVAHVPANNFAARVLAQFRGWTFSAVERYGGANFDDDRNMFRLPSFWNTDVYAQRRFGKWAPYVAVENLWDRRYAVELTPGAELNAPRSLTAGIRIRWDRG